MPIMSENEHMAYLDQMLELAGSMGEDVPKDIVDIVSYHVKSMIIEAYCAGYRNLAITYVSRFEKHLPPFDLKWDSIEMRISVPHPRLYK